MTLQKIKQGFTLVELIVVITILAILWTIAFISLQWYSRDSRDWVRLADLWSMETSLELFNIAGWQYPEPTNPVDITYSWWTVEVWTQWTFWDSVMTNVQKLSKLPKDPLTDTEYTYSVTSNKKEFQLWAIVEWDTISSTSLINSANAESVIQQALLKWTYNGQVVKTTYNWTTYIFALPSIVTADLTVQDLWDQVLQSILVYNGYTNIPASYDWTNTIMTWWFDFNSSNTWAIVVFQWDVDELYSSWTMLKTFTINLQEAYSGSTLKNESLYTDLLSIDTSNDQEIIDQMTMMINNELWWEIKAWDIVVSWGWGWWLPYFGWLCDTDDISAWSYTIASCNLWTTTAWTWTESYWSYFQWWNNYGFSPSPTTNSNPVDASSNWPWNYYSSSTFITNTTSPNDWSSSPNTNLWWWSGLTTVTNPTAQQESDMQWPCPSWYHIPTRDEWWWLYVALMWTYSDSQIRNLLNIPYSWFKWTWQSYNVYQEWIYWHYWASSDNWSNSWWIYLSSTIWMNQGSYSRSDWRSIRCFKN